MNKTLGYYASEKYKKIITICPILNKKSLQTDNSGNYSIPNEELIIITILYNTNTIIDLSLSVMNSTNELKLSMWLRLYKKI